MTQATGAVIPALKYKDAPAAIAWLERAFGFGVQARYDEPDGTVAHAQLVLGQGMVMLGSLRPPHDLALPKDANAASTYLMVPDAAAVYASARAAGATFTMELREMEYGGRGFGCVDPEGYGWSVGEYDPWA